MAERPGPDPPLGISQLTALDKVSIRQKSASAESKYEVVNEAGEVVLYAREDASGIGQILGRERPLHVDVFDTQDRKVFSLRRPHTVGCDKMEVWVCGQLTSVVRQQVTLLKPVLVISDGGGRARLRVKGPVSSTGVCDYDVLNMQKKKIGAISKKWSGLRDLLSEKDCFQIRFPKDLEVDFKASIIGTCFLIDFLYFEN